MAGLPMKPLPKAKKRLCLPERLQMVCRAPIVTSSRSSAGVSEEIITNSAEETTNWGREFAKRLHVPTLVLLTGELGTGKTTLTKGIVAGLGVADEDDVTSPTFTLLHVY